MPASIASMVRRAALFVTSLLLCCTIEMAAQATSPSLPASVPMREVTDEVGRTVRIPVNPSRIVSLAPSLTETVYALGAEDRLVGDTDYCDYPLDAQKKAKVGGVIDPNLEQIAALHPDLVLVTKGANRLETVRALDTFGIPTYATDPHKVDEIITSTEKLANVLNVPAAGKAVAEDLQRRLAFLQLKLGALPPRRVLFVVWTEPLISVGKDTFIADALRKAGAVSIVDSAQDWPQISMEEVARLQPEYLIFAASHSDAPVHDFDSLANLAGWRILNAVRNRHYAVISDAVIRPAPRIVSAIEVLARQLHPEAFEEAPPAEKATPAPSSPAVSHPQPNSAASCTAASACSVELACAR
ncbi:MAG TPA: cobalamin-binding protein [Candidatus Sulfotelmatobacter sp.]|nr:cobalamin-binding protein [Candidatus Sulfotelmatobacter sp.]